MRALNEGAKKILWHLHKNGFHQGNYEYPDKLLALSHLGTTPGALPPRPPERPELSWLAEIHWDDA
jgi:hypothetical protein